MLKLKKGISEVSIVLPVHQEADKVATALRTELPSTDYEVYTWQELLPLVTAAFKMYDGFIFLWFFAVFIAMGFGIVNTTLMAVFERIRPFGHVGKWGYFETHYEAVLSGGDTWKKGKELERLFRGLFKDGLLLNHPLEDDRRLLDLTKTIHEGDNYTLYHRLDRLSLTLLPKWGVVRIGRQTAT